MTKNKLPQKIFLYSICLLIVVGILSCSSKGKTSDGTDPSKISNGKSVSEETAITPERIKELERRFQENPSSYISASDLANAFKRQKKFEEAIKVWDSFIGSAIGPDQELGRIDRAVLLTEIGESAKAYDELLKIASDENGKRRSEAYFQLGNLIATGKIEPPEGDKADIAIRYLEQALDLGQTDPLIYRRLADLSYSKKDLDQAREYLAVFLVVSPSDCFSWIDLGDWSKEAGDFQRARVYYEKALNCGNNEAREKAENSLRDLPAE